MVGAPVWAQTHVPAPWRERYGRRIEDSRLPTGQAARETFATTVGADGLALLAALEDAETPARLRDLPAVHLLRRVWDQHFDVTAGQVRLGEAQDLPPVAELIESPHEPEARYGAKRAQRWVGYKVHLTETCDDERPHLLTQVTTTLAPEADVEQLAPIQEDLARTGRRPSQHLVDGGYVGGGTLVSSRDRHGIDLVGPVAADPQWQARPAPASISASSRSIGRGGGDLPPGPQEPALVRNRDGAGAAADPRRLCRRRLHPLSGARPVHPRQNPAAPRDAPAAGRARGHPGRARPHLNSSTCSRRSARP